MSSLQSYLEYGEAEAKEGEETEGGQLGGRQVPARHCWVL